MQTHQASTAYVVDTRGAPTEGVASACFAIVWVRGLGDERAAAEMIDAIERVDGVVSADFSHREPYILTVGYDRRQTRTRQVLEHIRGLGVQAAIVGC